MGDANRAVGGVDRLAAWTARAEDVDAQILLVDLDVDLFGLGQHGHGCRRGVDATAGLGLRDTLHAVDTGLEFKPLEDVAAGDRGPPLLQPAYPGLPQIDHPYAPAVHSSVPLVLA